jgi:AraC-like DNA-binding protein
MIYLEREPGPELRPWVRVLWYARGADFGHQRERVLPTGRAQVILNLARDFFIDCVEGVAVSPSAPALMVGQRSVFEIIDTSDLADLIGIVFEPGALPVFLADAADQVTNRSVALADVWPNVGALRDRLRELPGPETRVRCLEGYLRDRFARRRGLGDRTGAAVHPAVEFALREVGRSPSVAKVAAVAESTGWSARRFSQVFREQVGFTPKAWCRIQRFQRVVRQLQSGDAVRWPEVALACGFYDQSHLANEFRAFSGISPTTYAADPGRVWANHVRVS